MKSYFWSQLLVSLALLLGVRAGLCKQPRAIETSMCAIDADPKAFNGRMVKVRGSVVRAEGIALYADDQKCHTAMALRFPDEQPRNSAPRLVHDDAFQRFLYYVQAQAKEQPKPPSGVVSLYVAPQYCDIRVTVVGKFQAVSEEKALHGRGFGNGGLSVFQLIVQSVLDPEAKECPPLPQPPSPPPIPPPPEWLTQPPPPPPHASQQPNRRE